jgi:hypothetical protein
VVHALCIVALGVVQTTLPAETFTLAWEHSVQKTRWEERYAVLDDALVLVEARVQGSGAGMEAPPEARFDRGWWRWNAAARLAELTLAASAFTADYELCTPDGCRALAGLARATGAVTLRPCRG